MSEGKRSLTPAQIQYLKIGPKVCNSNQARKVLNQVLEEDQGYDVNQLPATGGNLNKIPKFSYGGFQKTVNNFGVLINKNFGTETTLHQVQKFGPIAKNIDKILLNEKDNPPLTKKLNALNKAQKNFSDSRTSLKTIYSLKGEKIFLQLKSFSINSINPKKTIESLPLPYLKFLINHVSSSKLTRAIESSMKPEGIVIAIQYDKMDSKYSNQTNNESKYQNIEYTFEKSGQILSIGLPSLEFHHIETDFKQTVYLDNRQILEIVEKDFDNLNEIVQKYLNLELFEEHLGKTGMNQHSIPIPEEKDHLDEEEEGDEGDQGNQRDEDNNIEGEVQNENKLEEEGEPLQYGNEEELEPEKHEKVKVNEPKQVEQKQLEIPEEQDADGGLFG